MNRPIISFQDYGLRKGSFALEHISLDLYPKEILAVLGKTGSGKTLLLESAAGYYKGNTGEDFLRDPVCDP